LLGCLMCLFGVLGREDIAWLKGLFRGKTVSGVRTFSKSA